MTINSILNKIRNVLLFKIKYPWIKHGRNIHCQYSATFWSPHKNIVIGNNVGIGPRCYILCDIEIGSQVLIGPEVAFLNSDDHRFDIIGKTIWDSGRGDKFKVVVADDVWIGHGSIILAPVTIGTGSIIAAGSVVTKDVAPYSIVAGVPAKVLRMRFTTDEIEEHERILFRKSSKGI